MFPLIPMDKPQPRKKEVDVAALSSAFMRIPRMRVEAARDLLDLGFTHPDQLAGRCPEGLFEKVRLLHPGTPADRVHYLRMAVYFAETPEPDPRRLHPAAWA